MKAQGIYSMLSSVFILALACGAPRSWGTAIEGGCTEVVTNLWEVNDDLCVGEKTPDNALIITNGGHVYNGGVGAIGKYGHADNNMALVKGDGSIWESRGGLVVGSAGSSNSLTVADCGRVSSVWGVIGNWDSDSNTLLVTGDGSIWENDTGFQIGVGGSNNSAMVANGGLISSYRGCVGNLACDNNMVVFGIGSVWDIRDTVHVGWEGPGNALTIADGGQVNSSRGLIGSGYTASNNAVLVTGSGSVWRNDQLTVGDRENCNKLTIADGGEVDSRFYGYVGVRSENNRALVTGYGSIWSQNHTLYVGRDGSENALRIEDGGLVSSTEGRIGYGYYFYPINNCVQVTGAGSTWEVLADIYVGMQGSGNSLRIEDGGLVSSSGGRIGYGYRIHPWNINNVVLVSGEGSQWRNAGELEIGSRLLSAGNTLLVASNATVSAASVTVHNYNMIHLESGGMLVSSGNFANANLRMYISGMAPSDCGRLSVHGEADLTGNLDIILDGFMPFFGDVFDLFDWNGPVVSSFTAINLPSLPRGFKWNTDALYTTGELFVDGNVMPVGCIVMPPVNLKSRGRLPVKILSTDDFDATAIDPASVRLAGAAPIKHILTDLDGDGYPDLKLFFNAPELAIDPDDPSVQVVAQDYAGEYMVGLPLIRVVPDE